MDEPETVVVARYTRADGRISLIASQPSSEWMSLWSICHEATEDVRDENLLEISIPVWVVFRLGSALRMHARAGQMRFDPDEETKKILRSALINRREIEEDVQLNMARGKRGRTVARSGLR